MVVCRASPIIVGLGERIMSRLMLRSVAVSTLAVLIAVAPAFGQTKPKAKAKPKPAAAKTVEPPKPEPAPPPKTVTSAKPSRPLNDAELATRLHELVRAKGVYVLKGVGRDFCIRLGSRPIGNCEVFRAAFYDNDGKLAAVFYSNNDARKNALHLFITTYLEKGYIDDYRTGLDGKLERTVRHYGDATSRVDVVNALPGFNRAMDFLRGKWQELETVPDAKLVDDESCGAGKVKRTPAAESEAVCIDRKRLEAAAH
jgi:hypothetical protein